MNKVYWVRRDDYDDPQTSGPVAVGFTYEQLKELQEFANRKIAKNNKLQRALEKEACKKGGIVRGNQVFYDEDDYQDYLKFKEKHGG